MTEQDKIENFMGKTDQHLIDLEGKIDKYFTEVSRILETHDSRIRDIKAVQDTLNGKIAISTIIFTAIGSVITGVITYLFTKKIL